MRVQCPLVGPVHHAARMAFAREHENWQLHHCHPVLFTDDIAGMCLTTIITHHVVWCHDIGYRLTQTTQFWGRKL